MNETIYFLLGFIVGTLAYRGWKYLRTAKRRDFDEKLRRGRKRQERMERRQRPERTLERAQYDSGISWAEFTRRLNEMAGRKYDD